MSGDMVQLGAMRRQDWQQALALVRRMELRPGGMVWGKLLDALEVDRPPRRDVVPIASRRADLDEKTARGDRRLVEDMRRVGFEKAERVSRLERLGQDEAMRLMKGGLL